MSQCRIANTIRETQRRQEALTWRWHQIPAHLLLTSTGASSRSTAGLCTRRPRAAMPRTKKSWGHKGKKKTHSKVCHCAVLSLCSALTPVLSLQSPAQGLRWWSLPRNSPRPGSLPGALVCSAPLGLMEASHVCHPLFKEAPLCPVSKARNRPKDSAGGPSPGTACRRGLTRLCSPPRSPLSGKGEPESAPT